jgi:hypothetical protein
MASNKYAQENKVTHAGVEVSGWAGDFDCSVCRRKRLTASEFSKKMQEKHRKSPTAELKCKSCVEKMVAEERGAAASKQETIFSAGDASGSELHECSKCKNELAADAFNKNQLRNKGPGKQRCKACITVAEKEESDAVSNKQGDKLRDAKQRFARAEATGSVSEKLVAASALAAAEAELVTGLAPVVLGRGRRGRGGRGGKGKGTWRGRGRTTGK